MCTEQTPETPRPELQVLASLGSTRLVLLQEARCLRDRRVLAGRSQDKGFDPLCLPPLSSKAAAACLSVVRREARDSLLTLWAPLPRLLHQCLH